MIDWNLFGPFVIAVIVVAVVPGPDMILIATLGSLQGPRAGFAAAAGMPVGTVVHVAIVAAGMSAALRSSPTVFEVVQWAGVGYLLYLASKTWRSAGVSQDGLGVAERNPTRPVLYAFRRAAVTDILNPKMILFNLAFLPQFTNPDLGHLPLQIATLGGVLVVISFVIEASIGYFAGTMGQRLRASSQMSNRHVNRLAAGAFVGLAGWLAVT